MKIAIYGDSFTEAKHGKPEKSWVQHLSTLGYDKVDNYGYRGSSCYYSYKKFCDTYTEYDKIIFLVTNHGRFWINKNSNKLWQHLSTVGSCDSFLKWPQIPHEDKERINVLKNFMILALDDEQESHYQSLMLNDVISKCPEVIMIPCFENISSNVPNWEGLSMIDICYIDVTYFNLSNEQWGYPGLDLRHCHMNDDNNIIFGNKIHEYIQSGSKHAFRININDYVNPTMPVEHYFTWPGQPNWPGLPDEGYQKK